MHCSISSVAAFFYALLYASVYKTEEVSHTSHEFISFCVPLYELYMAV